MRGAVLGFTVLLVGILAAPASAQTERPITSARGVSTPEPRCEGGVVYDDGSLETGYGFVPSVFEGQFLQRFDPADIPPGDLESVCLCWVRTREDDEIDYDVVFYEDRDGEPDFLPYASVPAVTSEVPNGIVGVFDEIDVSGVELPDGPVWIGARWDAGANRFFFVCADHGPADDFVSEVDFSLDRGRNWVPVLESGDPIFTDHRALMVRLSMRTPAVAVPVLHPGALVALVALLGTVGALLVVRRREIGPAPGDGGRGRSVPGRPGRLGRIEDCRRGEAGVSRPRR